MAVTEGAAVCSSGPVRMMVASLYGWVWAIFGVECRTSSVSNAVDKNKAVGVVSGLVYAKTGSRPKSSLHCLAITAITRWFGSESKFFQCNVKKKKRLQRQPQTRCCDESYGGNRGSFNGITVEPAQLNITSRERSERKVRRSKWWLR